MSQSAPTQGQLRSARRLLQRKFREQSGTFLVEGPQAVREALAAGVVHTLWVADGSQERNREFLDAAVAGDLRVLVAASEQVGGLSDTVAPQGLVAECHQVDTDLDALPAHARLVVLCAQVRDPGNAGTVIRCADAFGADAVLFSAGSVEVHNPKVVRASVGSLFHLPIVTGVQLENTVGFLRDRGFQVLAADGSGSDRLDQLGSQLNRPTAWVFGNEAWGLPREHAVLADRIVAVPLFGKAESLNLATAAAVCLFTSAAAQQQTTPREPEAKPPKPS